jgi:glycosyltransferase involved in cell wall biosynthesis
MAEPLITIGITCYSEGDWLLECWDSVLSQTDDRWLAVMVMDGTNHERTRQVFENINHPKLTKYSNGCNLGPYPTRNKAFELTKTPYHFYLDGDDQLLPYSIALALEGFAKHPDAGFVYGDYQCFGGADSIWAYPRFVIKDNFLDGQPIPGPCAYRKAVWAALGGYANELARGNADYDFFIGANENGIKGYHCGAVYYRYRVGHSGKVSSSYKLRYHETHEIMVQRHSVFFRDRRRRNYFLASGYKKAAEANCRSGNTNQASNLAWAALRHGMWHDRSLWTIVLKGLLPIGAQRFLRHLDTLRQNAPSIFSKRKS